jgi:hypothetical protein
MSWGIDVCIKEPCLSRKRNRQKEFYILIRELGGLLHGWTVFEMTILAVDQGLMEISISIWKILARS